MAKYSFFDYVEAFPRSILVTCMHMYRRLISPLYGNVCNYFPTCSAYTTEALLVHGAIKGSFFAFKRLASCHPWRCSSGLDSVPLRSDGKKSVGLMYSLGDTKPGIIELNHPLIEE